MPPDTVKPPYNAKRRIQFLFGLSIFLIVAATAGWFFVAGKIEDVAASSIEQQRLAGVDIVCEDRDVRGYPFRFGIFCDALAVSMPDKSRFSAGEVRSAAQFYDPNNLIVELDGPAEFEARDGSVLQADWTSMRLSTIFAQPIPERVSIFGNQVQLSWETNASVIIANAFEAHMRVSGVDIDIALRTEALDFDSNVPQIADLPPLGADFDIRLENAAAQIAANQFEMRGTSGVINRAAILLNDDQGLLISGPVAIDGNGLLDGELTLRIIDIDAVTAIVSSSLPQLAPMVSAFAEGQPRTGEKNDEVELNISIDKSQIRMGFIPLGKLKPF